MRRKSKVFNFASMPKIMVGFCAAIAIVLATAPTIAAATCDPGYYLENGTCVLCPHNYYCVDNIKHECPDAETHRRTSFPDYYYNPQLSETAIDTARGFPAITSCRVLSWYSGTRAGLYEYAFYNPDTQKYDLTVIWNYDSAKPGYYLTQKSDCGAYAYYKTANPCPAGSYCPGKERVECNTTNQATVHTETFGLEPCPDGYTSDAGATSINQCHRGTCTVACVHPTCPDHATCTYSTETVTGTDYYGTGCDAVAPTCSITITCDTGYQLVNGACIPLCQTGITHLHVGTNIIPLWATAQTSPTLVIQTAGGRCYGNLTPGTGTGINVSMNGQKYHTP